MNRLVIVGNGFDLAHGIKTGYNDFILWYIKFCFQQASEKGSYEDDELKIKCDRNHKVEFGTHKGIDKVVQYFYDSGRMSELTNNQYLKNSNGSEVYNPFKVAFKSDFISTIINTCSTNNWVVIENEYYQCLKLILINYNVGSLVQELNKSLQLIIIKLAEYLNNVVSKPSNITYLSILRSKIIAREIVTFPF